MKSLELLWRGLFFILVSNQIIIYGATADPRTPSASAPTNEPKISFKRVKKPTKPQSRKSRTREALIGNLKNVIFNLISTLDITAQYFETEIDKFNKLSNLEEIFKDAIFRLSLEKKISTVEASEFISKLDNLITEIDEKFNKKYSYFTEMLRKGQTSIKSYFQGKIFDDIIELIDQDLHQGPLKEKIFHITTKQKKAFFSEQIEILRDKILKLIDTLPVPMDFSKLSSLEPVIIQSMAKAFDNMYQENDYSKNEKLKVIHDELKKIYENINKTIAAQKEDEKRAKDAEEETAKQEKAKLEIEKAMQAAKELEQLKTKWATTVANVDSIEKLKSIESKYNTPGLADTEASKQLFEKIKSFCKEIDKPENNPKALDTFLKDINHKLYFTEEQKKELTSLHTCILLWINDLKQIYETGQTDITLGIKNKITQKIHGKKPTNPTSLGQWEAAIKNYKNRLNTTISKTIVKRNLAQNLTKIVNDLIVSKNTIDIIKQTLDNLFETEFAELKNILAITQQSVPAPAPAEITESVLSAAPKVADDPLKQRIEILKQNLTGLRTKLPDLNEKITNLKSLLQGESK